MEPYRANHRCRWDSPEYAILFGDTLRRLQIFKGTRLALKRKGFQKDVELIANATSEHCLQAMQLLTKANDKSKSNLHMMDLAYSDKIALEFLDP